MQKQLHVLFRKLSSTLKIVFSFVSAKKSPSKKASTFGGGCGRCCRGRCCGRLVIAWATEKTSLKTRRIRFLKYLHTLVALVDGCKVSVVMVVKRRSPPRSPPHLVVVVAGAAVVVVVSSLLEQPRRPPINSNLHYLLSCLGTTKKNLTSQQTTTLGGGGCCGGGAGGSRREEEGEQGLEKAESEMNQVSLNLWRE